MKCISFIPSTLYFFVNCISCVLVCPRGGCGACAKLWGMPAALFFIFWVEHVNLHKANLGWVGEGKRLLWKNATICCCICRYWSNNFCHLSAHNLCYKVHQVESCYQAPWKGTETCIDCDPCFSSLLQGHKITVEPCHIWSSFQFCHIYKTMWQLWPMHPRPHL